MADFADKIRAGRIATARNAISQAQRHIGLYPAATGTPVIMTMMAALSALLVEIERPATIVGEKK